MKYNYPAWKWVATRFLLPFLWGILQKQTFHFYRLIEYGTFHSLIHISSPQKLLFIIDWKITSLLPTESLTDRAARFSLAEASWLLTDEPVPGSPRGASAVAGSWGVLLLQGRRQRSPGWAAAGACGGCAMAVGSHPGFCPEIVGLGCFLGFCFWPWVFGDIILLQPLALTSVQDWLHSLRVALQSPLSPHSYRVVVVNPWSLVGLHA